MNNNTMKVHIYSQKSFRYFDVDEQSIIKMYVSVPPDRDKFLVDITRSLTKTNDKTMLRTMLNIIKKVRNMTVLEFGKIDLSDALEV